MRRTACTRASRAVHTKGVLCTGTFTPSSQAAALSRAPHLAGAPVRARVRFSNGSGDPTLADAVRDARGMAVKLYLPDGSRTDIVAISLPAFFARTPEDLLAFNEARRPAPTTGEIDVEGRRVPGRARRSDRRRHRRDDAPDPRQLPRRSRTTRSIPSGSSAADGSIRYGRYHLVPAAGEIGLTDEEAAGCAPDYLAAELADRLAKQPASFDVDVQLAAGDDPIDDPTVVWPADRETIVLGRLDITGSRTTETSTATSWCSTRREPRRDRPERRRDLARPARRVFGVGRTPHERGAGRLTPSDRGGAYSFGGRRAGNVNCFGALRCTAQHECALEDRDDEDRERTRLYAVDAGVHEPCGHAGDPALEHLRRGLAQRLARARDLERDGCDRARVGVIRRAQHLGRTAKKSETAATGSGAASTMASNSS